MLLFQSFKLLQQEKLMVIKKEFQHLYHIADFYQDNQETQRSKIARTLSEDITHHTKYISELNKKIQANYDKNKDKILHFLTFYDLYNKEIERILKVVKTIQSKLSQFLQDRFNQYLPIPMTTKRYSSKGFLDYLDGYYAQILQKQNINKTPMIFWGHVSAFTTKKSIENSPKETPLAHYIETAYWNYEIPFLLPIITHELGHIALENEESSLSKIQKILFDLIKITDIDEDEDFLKELASDIFAYTIHGHPYLIVLCHELLGEKFANQFYNESLDDIVITTIPENNIKFNISLTRIKTLLNFIDIYDQEYRYNNLSTNPSNSKNIIKEIYDIIDYIIIPLDIDTIENTLYRLTPDNNDNKTNSLAEIYTLMYPGLTQDYISFHYVVTSIPNQLFASKDFNEDISKEIFKNILQIKEGNNNDTRQQLFQNCSKNTSLNKDSVDSKQFERIFIDLTEARFSNLDYSISKNKFRQLLLDTGGEAKPYELTLYKTRTDSPNSAFTELKNEIQKACSDNPAHVTNNTYFTFGFFTALSLNEKKEYLTNEEIMTLLKSNIETKKTPFYQYKYSLIKLWDNGNGNNYEDNGLHMILQLQLRENTTEATNSALSILKKFFRHKHNKHKIEIFKALGPKEMIIKCHSTSIEHIEDARQKLLLDNTTLFRRSYTILYGDYEKMKKDNINNIMTIVRKKSQKPISQIKESCQEDIDKIYYTSGVTDIQIHWKEDTTIESIFSYYDKWTTNKLTTDIQTHIIRTI